MTDLTRQDYGQAVPRFRRRMSPSEIFFTLVQALLKWHQRSADRRRIAELDEHLLRDIGLTRDEVNREAKRYFWQG